MPRSHTTSAAPRVVLQPLTGHDALKSIQATPQTQSPLAVAAGFHRALAAAKPGHADVRAAIYGKHFDVIDFYNKLRFKCPIHKIMAQRYLNQQSTEGSSERSFSVHSLTATDLRERLGVELTAMFVLSLIHI